MKKNTTKILMAALALFMAIGIATGTTFAWFAMQQTVTATGMQIEAKSNSTFLLIGTGDDDTADEIQAAALDTVTLTVTDLASKVYPSRAFFNDDKDPETATGFTPTAVTTKATAEVESNWYTANSSDPTVWGSTTTADSNDKVINKAQLTNVNFSKYVIKKTVYLTLADGSTKANNLTVTPTITMKDTYHKTSDTALQSKTYYTESAGVYTAVDSGDLDVANIGTYYEKANNISAVKVLVVTDNDQVVVLNSSSGETNLYAAGHNANLTDTTVHTVDIYIYYDGTESVVYTNNAVNLSGAEIELQFDVEVNEN